MLAQYLSKLTLQKALPYLLGGYMLHRGTKDVIQRGRQHKLAERELSLQEKMLAGQLDSSEMRDAANREAAQEYMKLWKEEKSEKRKREQENKRLQLLMMMMGSMQNVSQSMGAANYAQTMSEPTTRMMELMGRAR